MTVNRNPFSALGALTLAVLLGSTACAEGDGAGSGPDRSPAGESTGAAADPSQTPGRAGNPEARQALRSAFRRLSRANTGHYEVEAPFGDGVSIREQGDYQLGPVAFETVRAQETPEGGMTLALVGVGDERWMRLESVTSGEGDSPGWPCWVDHSDLDKLGDLPLDLTAGPNGQPPSAITAASWGIGEEVVSRESIEGTTDLALTLGLLGGKFVAAAGIDPQAEDTVPATFTIDERVLSGFTVRLADLPDAIEAAGGDWESELGFLPEAPGDLTVRFSDVGVPVTVQAPPADERLEFSDAGDFEPAMRACGAP